MTPELFLKWWDFYLRSLNASSNKAILNFPILVFIFTNCGSTMSCTEGILNRGTGLALLVRGATVLVTSDASVALSWTSDYQNK